MAGIKALKISTLVFETKYSFVGPKILPTVIFFQFAYKPIHFSLPFSPAVHRKSNLSHALYPRCEQDESHPHFKTV